MTPDDDEDLLLRIATIGAAHGLRGDVRLQVHTEDPEQRLAPGTELHTDPPERGPLTVEHLWRHRGTHHARFAGHLDRTAAENLRGVLLLGAPVAESEAWYPHQLRGLRAVSVAGEELGVLEGVQHLPAQDVLLLRTPAGQQVMVPFVHEIVPQVDVPGGAVVIDPPPGLLPEPEPEPGQEPNSGQEPKPGQEPESGREPMPGQEPNQ